MVGMGGESINRLPTNVFIACSLCIRNSVAKCCEGHKYKI